MLSSALVACLSLRRCLHASLQLAASVFFSETALQRYLEGRDAAKTHGFAYPSSAVAGKPGITISLHHQVIALQFNLCVDFSNRLLRELEAENIDEEVSVNKSKVYVMDSNQNAHYSGGGEFAPYLATHGL